MGVSLTIASGGYHTWIQPRAIELINYSCVGVAVYAVVDATNRELKYLHTVLVRQNLTIEVVPSQGEELFKFHEICSGDLSNTHCAEALR